VGAIGGIGDRAHTKPKWHETSSALDFAFDSSVLARSRPAAS